MFLQMQNLKFMIINVPEKEKIIKRTEQLNIQKKSYYKKYDVITLNQKL